MTKMADVAKEYGAALFMVAVEENECQQYALELEKITAAFEANPEFEVLLASPNISLRERTASINAVFGGALSEKVLSFLCLLCEKGRMDCFSEAAMEFNSLFADLKRVSNALVTSAVALSDSQKQRLKEKLEKRFGGQVNLEYKIDSSLIGGVTVEINGRVIDGSLRHRLSDVKDVIAT